MLGDVISVANDGANTVVSSLAGYVKTGNLVNQQESFILTVNS